MIALKIDSDATLLYTTLSNASFTTEVEKKHEFSNIDLNTSILIPDQVGSPSRLTANGISYLSGDKPYLGINTNITVKTNQQHIATRMHKNWDDLTSQFKLTKETFSNSIKPKSLAQFDTPTKLTIQSTFVETVPGVSSGFEFKNPWLVEADGQTQANAYKSYSGTKQFDVFRNTNIDKNALNSQPTYLLKASGVTQSGIEFFELNRSASNAQLVPTGVSGEEIVSLTNTFASINRIYKAKNHSSLNTVVSLDHRRKIVTSTENVFRTYLSGLNELGRERLWVQSRPISSQTWANEFEIPLQNEMVNTFLSTGYKNSAIAYSKGSVWIVAEAIYEDFPNPSPIYYSLIAIRIDHFGEANQSLHPTIIATKSGSPFHSYAIDGFNETGSSDSKIAIAYMASSSYENLKLAVVFKNNNTNENTVQHTSSTFSLWTTVNLSDLDVAINGNFIGLSTNFNGGVLFAEAIHQVYGAFNWTSGATQLIYGNGFSNLGTGASITKWGNSSAFKLAYNASMVVNGSTHYGIAYKNIGSTATNTALNFNYGSGTVKKAVELSRTDVDMYSNSVGNIVFTYWVDTATNDYLEQKKVLYGGAYSVLVQTIPLSTINRSLAPASSNSLVLGTFASPNNGLFKLNEMQHPIVAKGKESETNYFEELVVIAEPNKMTEDVKLSFIAGLHIGKTQIRTYAIEDSLNAMALSDWFEWQGEPLHLDFHAYKKNPIAFNLI